MSYRYQLRDARASAIKKVAGVCADGDEFRDYVNEATERLTKRGDWYGTQVVGRFCFEGCDVVFPRWVGTVEGVKICGGGQVPVNNQWWSILGPRYSYEGLGTGYQNYGQNSYGSLPSGWFGVGDNGIVPTYSQVSGTTGKQIAYHATRPEDIGKTVTIYGFQYGGQPLCELRDGVWSQGITITAKAAGGTVLPAMTSALVTKITSVVREATKGICYLYEYGQDADDIYALRDIAMYQPTETNPSYRRMKINGICGIPACTDDNGRRMRSLDAIVKLEFIPAVSDDDFLLIDDFSALKLAVQGIRLEEAEDTAGAELKFISALREMNYTDRSKSPAYQTSVRVNVSSARCLVNPT